MWWVMHFAHLRNVLPSLTSGDRRKHSAQIRINFCIQTQVYCWKTLWTQTHTLSLSNVNILKHMTSTILVLLIWSQLDHLKKLRFFFFLLECLHTSLKKNSKPWKFLRTSLQLTSTKNSSRNSLWCFNYSFNHGGNLWAHLMC